MRSRHRGAGICHHSTRKRQPLDEVLRALMALIDRAGPPPMDEGLASSGYAPPKAEGTSSTAMGAPVLTPLSVLQVREQRRAASAEDGEASVQRNVSEAFDNFIRRLNQVYTSRAHGRATAALYDFEPRLRYWRDSCAVYRPRCTSSFRFCACGATRARTTTWSGGEGARRAAFGNGGVAAPGVPGCGGTCPGDEALTVNGEALHKNRMHSITMHVPRNYESCWCAHCRRQTSHTSSQEYF